MIAYGIKWPSIQADSEILRQRIALARGIPPAVLARGEEAFLRVLRHRHPDVRFVVRDA